jgi:hypothetical protein
MRGNSAEFYFCSRFSTNVRSSRFFEDAGSVLMVRSYVVGVWIDLGAATCHRSKW